MSDIRQPYPRRQTRPIPRVELAPIAPAPEEVTRVQCPMCTGTLTPEQLVDLRRAHEFLHAGPHSSVIHTDTDNEAEPPSTASAPDVSKSR